MFDSILAGVAAGLILMSTGDTPGNADAPEYVRIGTTSLYVVDIDKKSLSVEWGDGSVSRSVEGRMKTTPIKKTFIREDGEDVPVEHTILKFRVSCGTMTAEVLQARVYTTRGLSAISLSAGPLSQYKSFGVKPAETIIDVFCTSSKKKLTHPRYV